MLEDIIFPKDFLNLNFPVNIRYDGTTYPTAIHALYSTKAKDAYMHRICASRSAGYVSKIGRRAAATPDRLLTAYNEKHENIWGTCTCDKCGCNLVVDSFGTKASVKKKSGTDRICCWVNRLDG